MKVVLAVLLLGVSVLNAGYITPPLQAVLDTLSSSNKVRVDVHLNEKPDLTRFLQKDNTGKIAYMKEFARLKQTSLINYVKSYGSQVEKVKSFWIFSGFSFRGTKHVILTVAARPEVA